MPTPDRAPCCPTEPAYLAALDTVARRLQVDEGKAVFRAGDAAAWVFRVLAGEVRLVRHTPHGQELVLSRTRAGEFFAEAALTAEGGTYHCSAIATRRTQLLVFPIPAFRRRLQEDPEFAFAWIGTLSAQLRRQRSAVERLSLPGAAERIRHYLLTEGEPAGTLHLGERAGPVARDPLPCPRHLGTRGRVGADALAAASAPPMPADRSKGLSTRCADLEQALA